MKFCEGEDLHTWRYISGTCWRPLWQVSREEGRSYHSTEKKEKRINGMHSVSNKNKLTQYLLMSHFKVWAINIHFLRWSSDLVWEWIREVYMRALIHGLPTMKAQREKNVFECINYLCVFLERAQMQRWGCVPSVRQPENGCVHFILFDWLLYEGWLRLLGHPVLETILIDLPVTWKSGFGGSAWLSIPPSLNKHLNGGIHNVTHYTLREAFCIQGGSSSAALTRD